MTGYFNYALDNVLFAGTALYSYSSSAGRCQNNVFVNNHNELDFIGHTRDYTYVKPACMSYTFSDKPAGNDRVEGDPVFRDPKNGDYRIMPGSCLVGAGSVIASVTNDFMGVERGTNALTFGAFDLPDEFCCGLTFTAENNLIGEPITFRGYVHDPLAAPSETYTYNWEITPQGETDPALSETLAEFTTSALAAGRYSVTLTVTRASDSATTTFSRAPEYFYVGPATVHVNPASENPVFPYDTAATATRDLAVAYDTVVAPGTIHLAEGTHNLATQLFILKPVTITGSGYDITIICQTGTAHRVIYLGHKDAVVEKVGITGGNRTTTASPRWLYPYKYVGSPGHSCGGGVFIPGYPERAGTLRECRLFGNKYAGYWGGQLHAAGGLVDRCVIEGDDSMVNAANGGGVMLSGNATIRSTLITGNRASSCGGGVIVYYPARVRIINSTIAANFITATASSTDSGPGLYIAQSPENHPGRVEVVNTIIHGNHLSPATPEPAEFTLAANPDFFESQNSKAYVTIPFLNNLTSFDTTGYEADKLFSTNSLAADPLFKLSGSTPFKPVLNSPCVDNGVVEEWMYGAEDLIGRQRVAGASVDIGAYEKGLSTMLILR